MTNNESGSDIAADLRRRAEELAQENAAKSPEEILKILHELRLRQIEMEMQSEELRRTQLELKTEHERYFNLYDLAPVGYITLNGKGLILEANLTAAGLLGMAREKLVKQPLSRFILKEDQDIYYLHRKQLFESGEVQNWDLRMVKKDGTPFWAHLVTTAAQDGEGAPLCRAVISDITERKLTEQAIKETEEKYRVVFNNEIYAICIFDLKTLKILDVNDAYTRLYGYTREQIVSGMTIHDFTAEHQVSDAATQQAIREGTIFIPLRYHRKQDGTVFPVEIVGGPYMWQGHKVMFALIHDITQRKQSENIIFETSARLDIALTAANMAWWEMDIPSGLVTFEKRKAEMLGYAPEIFHHYNDFVALLHPEDNEKAMDAMRKHIEGSLVKYEVEYRILNNSGEYKWFYDIGAIVKRDSNDVPLKVAGIVVDITERKRAEDDLRLVQQQYRDMFETNTAIKLLIDPVDGAIIKANQAAAEFYGWSTNLLETMKISQINTLTPEQIKVEMSRAVSMERIYFEFSHRLASGEIRDVEVHSSPMESDRGTLLFSIIHDITQRKQADEQIRQLNANLEQRVRERTALLQASNQELETFAYTISHDLRSPLRAMDSFSAMLVSDYSEKMDQQGLHYLARIREGSQRMEQLIEDLLNLSKVTRLDLNRQHVDLSQLAHEVLAELQSQTPQRSVEFDISPNLVVEGDSAMLKIVLEKLLSNAFKFSNQREKASIQFGMSAQTGELVYFVRDNGVGFNMAYAGKLFAPFQRLHGIHEFPGSGIGLATVQRIITKHGGRIWPEAKENQGATFYFTLEGA